MFLIDREFTSDLAPPQFSAKFLMEDEGILSHNLVSAKPDPLPRLMSGNINRSNFTENRHVEQQFSRIEWSERDQWSQPSIRSAPQLLKKSASMASLSLGLIDDPPELFYHSSISRSRSITQPFHCIDTSNGIRSAEEVNGSSFYYEPAPRSAPTLQHLPKTVTISHPPPNSTAVSLPVSPKLPYKNHVKPSVCRYFLKGHCSRGDRCHYAHTSISGPASPVSNILTSTSFDAPNSHSRTLTSPETETAFSSHSRTLTSPSYSLAYPNFRNVEFTPEHHEPYSAPTLSPTSPLYPIADHTPSHSTKQISKLNNGDAQKQSFKSSKREEEGIISLTKL